MSTKRTEAEWVAYFAKTERELTLDEFAARATSYQNHLLERLIGLLAAESEQRATEHGAAERTQAMLWSIDHHIQRIWGAAERDEIWKIRLARAAPGSPPYPLCQLDDATEYRRYRGVLNDWDEAKADVLDGTRLGAIPSPNGTTEE